MGDCQICSLYKRKLLLEAYKRKLLLEAGLPRQALLMTIVRDLQGEGRAILTSKTDHGDFILDNLVNDIRPWDTTSYHFFSRQSQETPNIWLAIEQAVSGVPKSSGGMAHASN